MINNLKEAREFFGRDNFATEAAGITILSAEKGDARCMFKTTGKHLNADGFVMGGALYTLADLTFAVAANTKSPATVTLNGQINYLAVTSAPEIYAEAVCIRDGRTICVYTVNVTDSNGKKVAYATFTGFRKH